MTEVADGLYKLFVYEFVNIVASIGPDGTLLVDTGFDQTARQLKSKLIELGWSPMMEFYDGLKRTIEWYSKNRTWWQRLKK